VYIVGAGPGDPDLLTLRAAGLLQAAEVLVYDSLIAPAVLDLANPEAERIYVGKERGHHIIPQDQINALLVTHARRDKIVVRLKGGDPYIFGRGGEEVETLADNGIPFEVVPGVTAAAGIAAYSGIPLTHRAFASSCVFAAGHLKDGSIDLDWEGLVRPRQTVVIYMGLHGLPVLAEQLIAHGMPPDTPAAIVQRGTTPQQRVVAGTLATLPQLVEAERLQPPTLIIVGGVASLQAKLAWFETETVLE
jgi:uroporphyrin-III C-methyltransferase